MVRQKISSWIGDIKRSRFQKKLNISEQQVAELMSIFSFRRRRHNRFKFEDAQALQKLLEEPEFNPKALERLVENRLNEFGLMMNARAQEFNDIAKCLDQSKRIALGEMMVSCGHGKRRCVGA